MLKKKLLLLLPSMLFVTLFVQAQNREHINFTNNVVPPIDSTKGFYMPVFDTFRVMVVMAKFQEDEEGGTHWQLDEKTPTPHFTTLLSNSTTTFPEGSLTHFFHEASLGRFYYYGEFFPHIITVDSSLEYHHSKGGYGSANTDVLNQVINSGLVDWSLYDNWSKRGSNYIKEPDGVIDQIIIIYRNSPQRINSKYNWHGAVGGIASLSFGTLKINDNFVIHGGNMKSGLVSNLGNHPVREFLFRNIKHEIAHFLTLYHYASTQEVDGIDFTTHGSWGLAATSGSSSDAANAWDREFLGWTQYRYIFTPENYRNSVFQLRDFITTGDAVKIQLPHVKDEWFLLEFHNNEAYWGNVDNGSNGLFIFHQTTPQGPHLLDLEEANGNYDYELTQNEPALTRYIGYQWPKRKLKPNPFLGFGERDNIKLDANGDSILRHGDDPLKIAMYLVEGQDTMIYYEGTGNHGFKNQPGRDVFVIDTNPSSASNGKRRTRSATVLNGIRIIVLDIQDGVATIAVDFDDYNLHRDVRWTGDIILHDQLNVMPRVELLLDMSLTHNAMNRKFPIGNFIVKEGAEINMGRRSRLDIDNGSVLDLSAGGKVIMDNRSRIILKNGGSIINPENIEIGRRARVVFR